MAQSEFAEPDVHSQELTDDTIPEPEIDREAIVKAINGAGLLTYDVRKVRINDYPKSLFSLARPSRSPDYSPLHHTMWRATSWR